MRDLAQFTKLRSLDVGSPVWVRSSVDGLERCASIHFFGSSIHGSEYGLSVWGWNTSWYLPQDTQIINSRLRYTRTKFNNVRGKLRQQLRSSEALSHRIDSRRSMHDDNNEEEWDDEDNNTSRIGSLPGLQKLQPLNISAGTLIRKPTKQLPTHLIMCARWCSASRHV